MPTLNHSLAALLFILAASPVPAAIAQTDDQDLAYVRCLASRKVDPPTIPKQDAEACLIEAGIADPGDAAREQARAAWQYCLATNATRLDDGTSPAADISRAVVGLCADEWKAKVSSLWIQPAAKRAMISGMYRHAIDEGVQAVLLSRRMAKEQARPARMKPAI